MATDIRTSDLKSPIDVAEYLFRRLHEVSLQVQKLALVRTSFQCSLPMTGWDPVNPRRSRGLQSGRSGLHIQGRMPMGRKLQRAQRRYAIGSWGSTEDDNRLQASGDSLNIRTD